MKNCTYCNSLKEDFNIRPYGENGRDICFDCFEHGSKEIQDVVKKNCKAVLDTLEDEIKEGGVVVFTGNGPVVRGNKGRSLQ